MTFLRRKRPTPFSTDRKVRLDIDGATATRAMYGGPGIANQTIAISVRTTDDQVIEFDMTIDTAHTLIEQMTSAYYAIVPRLRTSRGTNV